MTDRPQQIAKPKVYGNFKARGLAKPKHKNSRWREDREGMDEQHLACIRQLPCVTCLKVPCGQAHHLKCTGQRGMAVRSTDEHTLPHCHNDHMDIENRGAKQEVAYYRSINIDPLALAKDLWNATGDIAKMTRIVIAHRCGGEK